MKAMKIATVVVVLVVLGAMQAAALDLDDAVFVEPDGVVCAAFAAEGISEECMAKASGDLTKAERCCWQDIMADPDARGPLNATVNAMLWDALQVASEEDEDIDGAYTVIMGRVWLVELPD